MHRILALSGLCALLCAITAVGARAQQISIALDPNSTEMLVDMSLRDAEIGEVLTALFNTTNGKYQLQVGTGVVGRIGRLQLTQTPFEKALDAIVGTDFSYTRQQLGNGSYMYKISGRRGPGTSPISPLGGGGSPMLAPPTESVPPLPGTDAAGGLPALSWTTKPSTGAGGTTATPAADGTTAGTTAAAEPSFLAMISVNNLDLEALTEALGGTILTLFDDSMRGDGGSSGSGSRRSSRRDRYNDSYYDDPYSSTSTTDRYAERERIRQEREQQRLQREQERAARRND